MTHKSHTTCRFCNQALGLQKIYRKEIEHLEALVSELLLKVDQKTPIESKVEEPIAS